MQQILCNFSFRITGKKSLQTNTEFSGLAENLESIMKDNIKGFRILACELNCVMYFLLSLFKTKSTKLKI